MKTPNRRAKPVIGKIIKAIKDLSNNARMKEIRDRLTNTPRKSLGWKAPAEVFREKRMEEMRRAPHPEPHKSRSSRSDHGGYPLRIT